MSQAAFAKICGVSKQAISKHKDNGRIVIRANRVDPAASLKNLEGHMAEENRQAGLKWLKARAESLDTLAQKDTLFEMPDGAGAKPKRKTVRKAAPPMQDEDDGSALDLNAEPGSWKALKDKYDALSREVDYRARQGELIEAAAVAQTMEAVFTTLMSEADRMVKVNADEFAAALKLDADQARELRSMMIRKNREYRANVERACKIAAGEIETRRGTIV